MICEHRPWEDENRAFIQRCLNPSHTRCKADSDIFYLADPGPVVQSPDSRPAVGGVSRRVTMQQVPAETSAVFERQLERAGVPPPQRPDCHRWVCFYLDFCSKYGHLPEAATSLGPFLTKLASKNRSVPDRSRAAAAVRLLLQASQGPPTVPPSLPPSAAPGHCEPPIAQCHPAPLPPLPRNQPQRRPSPAQSRFTAPLRAATPQRRPASAPPHSGWGASAAPAPAPVKPPAPAQHASWEREYRDLEAAVRMRNYSPKTLQAYRIWLRKFQAFVRSRPTVDLGTQEVRGFLSELAVRHGVAACTQNQAFNALLFFYNPPLRGGVSAGVLEL